MKDNTYLLFIVNKENKIISIGSLGKVYFKKGYYIYVGSAKNNLCKRIKRHLSKDKKIFWHIDYFLKNAKIEKVFVGRKKECDISKILLKYSKAYVEGFGSSDCKCVSHLFYAKYLKMLLPWLKLEGFKKVNVSKLI